MNELLARSSGKREKRIPRSRDFDTDFEVFEINDAFEHYQAGYRIIETQLAQIGPLKDSSHPKDQENVEFILRSALIYSSSIMDFYFHELARILYLKMIKGTWNESEYFKTMSLPLRGIREVLSEETDPDEWFSKNLIQKMDTDCYQGGNKIKNLLKSIDIAVTSDLCYPEGMIWAFNSYK